MLNMSLETSINSIPYLQYMEEQERKEKDAETAVNEEQTALRERQTAAAAPLT